MGEKSKIQWTDATWNPWHGCRKISTGCAYCYMFRDKERYGKDPTQVIKSKTKFNDPLKWQKNMKKHGAFIGMKIFTCSWSDWFIEEADDWRDEAWKIIKDTPEFTYQILTKRPERILECLPDDWGDGYDNVWLGVSAENDDVFRQRMLHLGNVKAKFKFLSAEPLLGQIDVDYVIAHQEPDGGDRLDWIIIGGESGNDTGKYRYRPMKIDWLFKIIEDCQYFNVPVFVKQLGTHLSKELQLKDRHGGDMTEWNGLIQIREFPKDSKNKSN